MRNYSSRQAENYYASTYCLKQYSHKREFFKKCPVVPTRIKLMFPKINNHCWRHGELHVGFPPRMVAVSKYLPPIGKCCKVHSKQIKIITPFLPKTIF